MNGKKKETKIVIFGAFDSGKTTTLDNLCEKKTKVEYNGTTVSMDYGNTFVDGEKIHLFATPGQERFHFMREILSNGLNGAIVVVDNTQGVTEIDSSIMSKLESKNIPYIIFANKQDLASHELEISTAAEIVPTIATEGDGLRQGLEILLNQI
ncbi:GTP-binding protein [Methanobacterium alcaliphilum]|uniref:GTP-binding protein n=1 Tax=Methanobacterium alcaliphilum TaxID=392018 RepID=UPI00200AD4B3|nr:GTP-binding protein [Methanobacterium alcaliphilum]MCK9150818.1 GTP-binding protein [Methanobacterium alcaliphilum]